MYVTFYVVSILKGADNIMNGKRNIFTCISIVGIGLASFSNSSFAASVTDNSIQNSIPVVNQQVAAAKEMKPFPSKLIMQVL